MPDHQQEEQHIEQLITNGDTETAVQALYELIIIYAKEKNFAAAERLRDQLMEVNSLALTEIVKSGEIIEAEKSGSIDKKHQKIWADLYELLSDEEGNALYMNLAEGTLDPDQAICRQGKLNDKLFFIDSGTCSFSIQDDTVFEFLKEAHSGQTVGHDTFFGISVSTASIITTSGVQLKYLPRTALDTIEEQHPGFTDKLETFCRKKEGTSLQDILQQKEIERRHHQRYKTSGKLTTQLLNNEGNPISSPFTGFLDDISKGGLSFSIKCSKKTTARMLLGRPARLTIGDPTDEAPKRGEFLCKIVCAKHNLFNDYSIHVRFQTELTDQQLKDMGTPA